ncbi:hypothetical protein D3C79_597440 [compost metagenome]
MTKSSAPHAIPFFTISGVDKAFKKTKGILVVDGFFDNIDNTPKPSIFDNTVLHNIKLGSLLNARLIPISLLNAAVTSYPEFFNTSEYLPSKSRSFSIIKILFIFVNTCIR